MNILHFVSTVILLVCIALLVTANRVLAKRLHKLKNERLNGVIDKNETDAEIHALQTFPLIGNGSGYIWTTLAFESNNGCYYRVLAERKYRWNRDPKLSRIIIKDFYYTPCDIDSKEYARRCAEELLDKLNEDCDI